MPLSSIPLPEITLLAALLASACYIDALVNRREARLYALGLAANWALFYYLTH